VQRFQLRAAADIDLLVHCQRHVRVGDADRGQHTPGVHQRGGADVGRGVGADVEHVAALQARIIADVHAVAEHRIGACFDHGGIDRPAGGQPRPVIGVRTGVCHDVQRATIARRRCDTGAQQGALADIDGAAAIQPGDHLCGTATEDTAAGRAGGKLAAQRAGVVVVGAQHQRSGRDNLGILVHQQPDGRVRTVVHVGATGVEDACAGAVRAARVVAVVQRPGVKAADIQHGVAADGQLRGAVGVRRCQRRVARNEPAGARRGVGAILVLAAGGERGVACVQQAPCPHGDAGGRRGPGVGVDDAGGQQARHAQAGGIGTLVAVVDCAHRDSAAARVVDDVVDGIGLTLHHHVGSKRCLHRVGAGSGGEGPGAGQIQTTGTGDRACIHAPAVDAGQDVQPTAVGQHHTIAYMGVHLGTGGGISDRRTDRQPAGQCSTEGLGRDLRGGLGMHLNAAAHPGYACPLAQPGAHVGAIVGQCDGGADAGQHATGRTPRACMRAAQRAGGEGHVAKAGQGTVVLQPRLDVGVASSGCDDRTGRECTGRHAGGCHIQRAGIAGTDRKTLALAACLQVTGHRGRDRLFQARQADGRADAHQAGTAGIDVQTCGLACAAVAGVGEHRDGTGPRGVRRQHCLGAAIQAGHAECAAHAEATGAEATDRVAAAHQGLRAHLKRACLHAAATDAGAHQVPTTLQTADVHLGAAVQRAGALRPQGAVQRGGVDLLAIAQLLQAGKGAPQFRITVTAVADAGQQQPGSAADAGGGAHASRHGDHVHRAIGEGIHINAPRGRQRAVFHGGLDGAAKNGHRGARTYTAAGDAHAHRTGVRGQPQDILGHHRHIGGIHRGLGDQRTGVVLQQVHLCHAGDAGGAGTRAAHRHAVEIGAAARVHVEVA